MNVYSLLAHAHPALVHAPIGAVLLALGLALLWLALWGAAGHWGGRMVFRDPPLEATLP